MPLVAWRKIRVADRLGSRALRAEAKETLAINYKGPEMAIAFNP